MNSRKFGLHSVFILTIASLATAACSTNRAIEVPSVNKDSRVAVIVIHHTSSDFADSLHVLTKRTSRPVSSHYLIPEPGDPSYDKDDLHVYALVPEEERAWHAGVSYWKGLSKLNNISVGIELVNRTYCHEPKSVPAAGNSDWAADAFCFYPDFDDGQIALLVDLLEGLKERHVEVDPTHIVGHSDIAPQRKIDPGPRFPWQRLYKLGYGAWYDDETVGRYWERFQYLMPTTAVMQEALHAYGYPIEQTGVYDEQTKNVLRAFQQHFLPWKVTGQIDTDTAAVLYALIEKYYPEELDPLLPLPADSAIAPSSAGGS